MSHHLFITWPHSHTVIVSLMVNKSQRQLSDFSDLNCSLSDALAAQPLNLDVKKMLPTLTFSFFNHFFCFLWIINRVERKNQKMLRNKKWNFYFNKKWLLPSNDQVKKQVRGLYWRSMCLQIGRSRVRIFSAYLSKHLKRRFNVDVWSSSNGNKNITQWATIPGRFSVQKSWYKPASYQIASNLQQPFNPPLLYLPEEPWSSGLSGWF